MASKVGGGISEIVRRYALRFGGFSAGINYARVNPKFTAGGMGAKVNFLLIVEKGE